jgi:hypothetical protein
MASLIKGLGPYSQFSLFFITYEWAQFKVECLSPESLSSLLKCKLKSPLLMASLIKGLGPYSQHFMFFITYEWVQLR